MTAYRHWPNCQMFIVSIHFVLGTESDPYLKRVQRGQDARRRSACVSICKKAEGHPLNFEVPIIFLNDGSPLQLLGV